MKIWDISVSGIDGKFGSNDGELKRGRILQGRGRKCPLRPNSTIPRVTLPVVRLLLRRYNINILRRNDMRIVKDLIQAFVVAMLFGGPIFYYILFQMKA